MTIEEQDKKLVDFMNEVRSRAEDNHLTCIGTVMTQDDDARALPFIVNGGKDRLDDVESALACISKMFYQYMIEELLMKPNDARNEIHAASIAGMIDYDLENCLSQK